MPLRAAPLVALLLAAGCLLEADPPAGSVSIYWTFGSPTLGEIGDLLTDDATAICTEAAVDDVRITFTSPAGDMRPAESPCITVNGVPGTGFDGLEPGTWGYYLEGRRGGVTVFDWSGDFEIVDGERTVAKVRAPPVVGNWDVVVSYVTGVCASDDRLKFDLVDTGDGDRVAFSTDDARVNPEVAVRCLGTSSFTIPSVPPGTYRFSDWVHLDATGAAVAYSTCRPAWTQGAEGSSSVSVDVTAAVADPATCQ